VKSRFLITSSHDIFLQRFIFLLCVFAFFFLFFFFLFFQPLSMEEANWLMDAVDLIVDDAKMYGPPLPPQRT
jgi:hypothetical protein